MAAAVVVVVWEKEEEDEDDVTTREQGVSALCFHPRCLRPMLYYSTEMGNNID